MGQNKLRGKGWRACSNRKQSSGPPGILNIQSPHSLVVINFSLHYKGQTSKCQNSFNWTKALWVIEKHKEQDDPGFFGGMGVLYQCFHLIKRGFPSPLSFYYLLIKKHIHFPIWFVDMWVLIIDHSPTGRNNVFSAITILSLVQKIYKFSNEQVNKT